MTLTEAAALLRCAKRTVRRRVDAGELASRVEYQGKQAVRLVNREDLRRVAGTVQRREPKTEIVTRGATGDNAEFVIRQTTKVVTGYLRKVGCFVLGFVVLGGVVTSFVVIRQGKTLRAELEGAAADLSQGVVIGLSQVQAGFASGLNETKAGLTGELSTLRQVVEADSKAAAERLTVQAETIERQNREIAELRGQVAGLVAGVEAIREAVTRPTPGAMPEPTPAEETGGAEL